MRGQVTVISRKRIAMASSALISRLAATASLMGEAFGDAASTTRRAIPYPPEGLQAAAHTPQVGNTCPQKDFSAVWHRQRAFFI